MYRHVTPGDKVRFQTPLENATRDAANAEQQRQIGEQQPRPDRRREQDVVRIQNLTGQDLERGDCVGIGDPLIAPAENLDAWYHRPAFKGEYPQWQPQWKHPGRFAILLEPCAKNAVASAAVSGCCQARIAISDMNHEYADIPWIGGGVRLVSGDSGSSAVQILSIEESTAPAGSCGTGFVEKWAYVRIQNGGQFNLVGIVTEVLNPITCSDPGSGGTETMDPCPPRGKVQIYWLNPSTGCLQAVLDRGGNQIYVCPYNTECRTLAVGEFVRLHCDRWATWWATSTNVVQIKWMKALECIQLGAPTASVQPVTKTPGTSEYVPGGSPTTVDNTECTVFALTDEVFLCIKQGCCNAPWIPLRPFGLTRYVEITSPVSSGSTGEEYVKKPPTGSASCDPRSWANSTCRVQFTNWEGNRKLTAKEVIKIEAVPGMCCFSAQPSPRPLIVYGTAGTKFCSTDTPTLSTPSWGNVSTWYSDPPTSLENSFGLAACIDAALVGLWDESASKYKLVQPKHVAKDIALAVTGGCDGIGYTKAEGVPLMGCGKGVCTTPEVTPVLGTAYIDLFVGMSLRCDESYRGLRGQWLSVAVLDLGCEIGSPADAPLLEYTSQQKVLTGTTSSEQNHELKASAVELYGPWCFGETSQPTIMSGKKISPIVSSRMTCDGLKAKTRDAWALWIGANDNAETIIAPTVTEEFGGVATLRQTAGPAGSGGSGGSGGNETVTGCELVQPRKTVSYLGCVRSTKEETVLESKPQSFVTANIDAGGTAGLWYQSQVAFVICLGDAAVTKWAETETCDGSTGGTPPDDPTDPDPPDETPDASVTIPECTATAMSVAITGSPAGAVSANVNILDGYGNTMNSSAIFPPLDGITDVSFDFSSGESGASYHAQVVFLDAEGDVLSVVNSATVQCGGGAGGLTGTVVAVDCVGGTIDIEILSFPEGAVNLYFRIGDVVLMFGPARTGYFYIASTELLLGFATVSITSIDNSDEVNGTLDLPFTCP